ncbi:MAG: luciferase, partial [Myxococcota bacterium]|nr:luciferase [Myxococcota bacterium]
LSITQPAVIEATHERMGEWFHSSGGPWVREYMPRTVMVFLNGDTELTDEQQDKAADSLATKALSAYWTALQGTLDPNKVKNAANNALIGGPETIAKQIVERFHPDDRLMLWFDFFNHNSTQVMQMMRNFKELVIPRVEQLRAAQ